jgi:hypothetical protein
MRIAIDIDTGSVRTWAGQPISALAGKRGDQYPVHVRYERGGAIIERPTGATGILGVKLASDPTGNFVALAGSWTKTGSGAQTVYLFSLNLNTTELETAFSTDPDSVSCVLEIETVAPGELISSATIPLEISNDVIRGNEGVPTDAMDPYPLPSAIELKAEKGEPNGYASLDAGGKVPASQLALVASQISDSTAAGRAMLTAANAQAQAGLLAGHVVLNTNPPTSPTNFSMFPGNVPPATGTYQAVDEAFLYVFKAGWTAWKRTPIASW